MNIKIKNKNTGSLTLLLSLVLASILLLKCQNLYANDLLQWQTTNIQLLQGDDYKIGSKQRDIFTLEHANGWRYGDTHLFVDVISPKGQGSSIYGELSPRLSLSKISGYSISNTLIKDVLLSINIEKPKAANARYLVGAAVDLDLDKFKFFKINLYHRNNPDLAGNTYQLTLAWHRAFSISKANFVIEGFADFAGKEGQTVAHQLIVPRFLIEAGSVMGIQKNKLWVGIEWQYWHNKFGNDGITESVPQLQIKWDF